MSATARAISEVSHVDVLIVGAGISGIGSAYHLQEQCPGKTYAILEMKDTFGGTWETHKYPGVRSDSDLYTFGYRFKPWIDAPIATSDKILRYMGEVIEENGIGPHIHYGHKITRADWDSKTNLWTLAATRKSDGASVTFTANFLWMCQGYYDHERPNMPEWPGMAEYKGTIVHAMQWDPAIEVSGKRVLVIGSGATSATVVPALARAGAQVTQLQRRPIWYIPNPNENELADALRESGIEEETIHRVVRAKINHEFEGLMQRCKSEPEAVKAELLAAAEELLGEAYAKTAPHITPDYNPWQERAAFIPEGDLYQAIRDGQASIVTDEVDRFTPTGVLTKSGQTIEADIVIAATGFKLLVLGGIPFAVDGRPVDWAETINYRGMLFTDVPNLAWVMGYFRASWTLRVDLMGDFVCRLLNHMDALGAKRVDVKLRPEDADMAILPWIEEDNFNPGYLMRDLHKMPRRGDKPEWRHNQHYWKEREELPLIDLDSSEFFYDGVNARKKVAEPA
ncbi:NAD(P)/FAD-dependent oxidoreductase [Novosphingobium sp.]|uniref:flavin-containing monooxygenase n=1 Tax=Novosphingobium sp. TaxID=1874826 RepID=UPI0025E91446|nr:NAD(P)/FAD-dependent oxidoreductase [Novosphingobium sp.]